MIFIDEIFELCMGTDIKKVYKNQGVIVIIN